MTWRRHTSPIVEGWGACWIDDLECHFCGRTWAFVDAPDMGPDMRQYVSINIEPKDRGDLDPDAIRLCPECADELADEIFGLLREDVPMGMKPEDTDTMCALPDDFYLYRSREWIEGLWWDEEAHEIRHESGERVPGNEYSLARAQRRAPSGPMDKQWRIRRQAPLRF